LPTLLAATAYKTLKEGTVLAHNISASEMLIGLGVAAVSAFFAVKGFVAFLNRRGLAVFGYYRIAFGIVLLLVLGRQTL
jgi:undecaprenyl-diphosphatase